MPDGPRYDDDYYSWTQYQAEVLRTMRAMLPELYGDARELADIGLRKFGENTAAARLPSTCPYTLEQIRERGWYPKTPS
jgi:hypothetical protein